jgi:argininosuccinate lyase
MKKPCFLLVESNTTGTGRRFAAVAKEMGMTPILVSADANRYPYVRQDALRTVRADTSDFEQVRAACLDAGAEFSIAGITSSSEHYIPLAAAVAESFGLPAPSPRAVSSCRDKSNQRAAFAKAKLPAPASRKIATVAEALEASAEIGLPVVVKPVSGTGSIGVKLCQSPQEVADQAATLLGEVINERGLPTPKNALVESYVEGEEFSVETFGLEVIGITRKYRNRPPYFIAPGHDYPGLADGAVKAAIAETVREALLSLGLGWGPAHTEITMKGQEVFLIEVNPRLGGAMIPELVRLASGIDLIRATVELATGSTPNLTATEQRYSSIAFRSIDQLGVVASVDGVTEAGKLPGVVEARMNLNAGDVAVRRHDFRDKIGYVIAMGDSLDEAHRRATSAVRLLTYETRPAA